MRQEECFEVLSSTLYFAVSYYEESFTAENSTRRKYMSPITVTTNESNDPPTPPTRCDTSPKQAEQPASPPDSAPYHEEPSKSDGAPDSTNSVHGQLALTGRFLRESASNLVRGSGAVATSLATSASSVATNAATSVVGSARTGTQFITNSLLSAGKQGAAFISTALDEAYYTGEALIGAGIKVSSDLTSDVIQSAQSSTTWLYDRSVTVGGLATELVVTQFSGLIGNAGNLLSNYVVDPIGGTVVSACDTLAGDPDASASVHMTAARMVAGFLPITGASSEIGKARGLYRQAQSLPEGEEKNSQLHRARRDCLIATTSLSLDVISYFATGGAAAAVKAGSTAFSALNVAKGAKDNETLGRFLPKINMDFLSPQADIALSSPIIREAMEIILRYDPKQQAE
jgi:hypothetical protein